MDANDFLPSKVPGLVAWYNGDIGLTLEAGVVTGWADQSPSQNDLSVFNDTGSNTDIKRNTLALNGHDVVTFSTGSLNNQTATGVDYGSLDFLVEVVARVTGCIGPCYLAVTGAPSGNALSGLLGVEADGGFIVRARHGLYPAIGPRIPFGEVHIFGAHENAGTLELRIDGKVVTTADAGTVTPVPRGIYLAGVGTSYAYGDIAEAIVVKAPSTTATTFVETYLRAKYGFK